MMAPEKLRPEDIDSAIAQATHGARPDRDEGRGERAPGHERAPQQTDWLEDRDEEADIPDIPEDELRVDEDQALSVSQPAPRRMLPVVAGGVGLLVVAALVWWMFRPSPSGTEQIPVVTAEPGEVKTKPAGEGGMQVQNQDLTVYGQIAGQPEPQGPQTVLPGPEAPMTQPAPPPAAAEAAPAGSAPAPTPAAAQPSAPAADQSEIDAVLAQMRASGGPPTAQAGAPEGAAPMQPAAGGSTQTAALPSPAPGGGAPTQAQAPSAAASGAVRVQLAAFKSESQAQEASQRLLRTFQDELSGRTVHVERADLGAKGVFFRIQAGPLASRDEAAALCGRLKQRGQPCIVVAP